MRRIEVALKGKELELQRAITARNLAESRLREERGAATPPLMETQSTIFSPSPSPTPAPAAVRVFSSGV